MYKPLLKVETHEMKDVLSGKLQGYKSCFYPTFMF